MNKIQIGIVARPQGLKGEIRINPITDDINRFNKLDYVYLNNKKFDIENVSIRGGFVVLKLLGLNTIEEVEHLRNNSVEINREDAVELNENEYYMVDLIGSKVIYPDGTLVGEIKNIDQFGPNHVVTVVDSASRTEFMFPFILDVLIKVDIDKKVVIVDAEKLEEVKA